MAMKRKDAVWQQAMYLVSKPNFKKDISAVRKKYGFPEDGFNSEGELEEWREKHVYYKIVNAEDDLDNKISVEVARIVGKPEYGLSPGWQHAVERFMYLNDVDDMQLPIRLDANVVKDKLTGSSVIQVIIAEDTTLEDYRENWKNVEYMRDFHGLKSPGRRRKADTFKLKQKKFAYDTWVRTASYVKTAKEVEQHFPDVYGEGMGNAYTPDDAKTDVRNFIKQAGI